MKGWLRKVGAELRREYPLIRPYLPLLLGVASVIGLIYGSWHTYKGLRDSKQLEISCEDYVRTRPDHHWLKLTNCEYDLTHYAYKSMNLSVDKVYLRLRPVGHTTGNTAIVVLRDDDLATDIADAWNRKETVSQADRARFQATLDKPVEGIATSALDMDDDDKKEIGGLHLDLTPDFVLIRQGAKPHLIGGLLLAIPSLFLGAFALLLFVRGRRAKRNASPPAAPKPQPPAPSALDPDHPTHSKWG